MKTFILAVMCLLAVADAHTVEPEGLEILRKNVKECAKDLSKSGNEVVKPLMSVPVWCCTLKRVGVIDENNKLIKKNGIKYCKAVMPLVHLHDCEDVVTRCIDTKDQMSGSDWDKTEAKIKCIIKHGVMDYIKMGEDK